MFVNFDGFGADTPMRLIRHISRSPRPEILVTVKTQWFVRFARREDLTTGDSLFGDPGWREIAKSGTPEQKRTGLVNFYRDQLHDIGFTHTLTFELLDEGGHELLLIFGTTQEKGLEKMKDAVWRTDPIQGRRFRDPRDVNQLELGLGTEGADLRLLKRQLLGRLECEGPQSLDKLKDWALLETIYRSAHIRPAVDALEQSGELTCERARKHEDFVVSLANPTLFSGY